SRPCARSGRNSRRHRSPGGQRTILLGSEAMTDAGSKALVSDQTSGIAGGKGKRVLLLVPAVTYRATDFLVAANGLGLDLVIGSNGALSLGGHPVVHVDPDDPDDSAHRLAARAGAVDAVVAVDTQMLVTAAKIAGDLGLPHNPVDAVMAAANKAEQ